MLEPEVDEEFHLHGRMSRLIMTRQRSKRARTSAGLLDMPFDVLTLIIRQLPGYQHTLMQVNRLMAERVMACYAGQMELQLVAHTRSAKRWAIIKQLITPAPDLRVCVVAPPSRRNWLTGLHAAGPVLERFLGMPRSGLPGPATTPQLQQVKPGNAVQQLHGVTHLQLKNFAMPCVLPPIIAASCPNLRVLHLDNCSLSPLEITAGAMGPVTAHYTSEAGPASEAAGRKTQQNTDTDVTSAGHKHGRRHVSGGGGVVDTGSPATRTRAKARSRSPTTVAGNNRKHKARSNSPDAALIASSSHAMSVPAVSSKGAGCQRKSNAEMQGAVQLPTKKQAESAPIWTAPHVHTLILTAPTATPWSSITAAVALQTIQAIQLSRMFPSLKHLEMQCVTGPTPFIGAWLLQLKSLRIHAHNMSGSLCMLEALRSYGGLKQLHIDGPMYPDDLEQAYPSGVTAVWPHTLRNTLTTLHLPTYLVEGPASMESLLSMPNLVDVCFKNVVSMVRDMSHEACRWQRLRLALAPASELCLHCLCRIPLHSLTSALQMGSEGMEALQVSLPDSDEEQHREDVAALQHMTSLLLRHGGVQLKSGMKLKWIAHHPMQFGDTQAAQVLSAIAPAFGHHTCVHLRALPLGAEVTDALMATYGATLRTLRLGWCPIALSSAPMWAALVNGFPNLANVQLLDCVLGDDPNDPAEVLDHLVEAVEALVDAVADAPLGRCLKVCITPMVVTDDDLEETFWEHMAGVRRDFDFTATTEYYDGVAWLAIRVLSTVERNVVYCGPGCPGHFVDDDQDSLEVGEFSIAMQQLAQIAEASDDSTE